MKESIKREIAIKLAKVLKEKGSLPVKVKQVLSKNLKKATPDPKSKRAKQFYIHHKYHSGPHITGQGAEHATYDFDDDDYEVGGGIQRRIKKDKQKRGYEPVENITKESIMKLKPKDIKKYNTLSKKKPIMVRVGHNWYTWLEGDPKSGVFLTTQSGRDVEFDFKQIDDIQESKIKITKTQLREMIKEEVQSIKEEDIKWKMASNALVNFLKHNTKSLDKAVKKKDAHKVRFFTHQIIDGLQNALKGLKFESVNEGKKTIKVKTVKNKKHQNQNEVANNIIKLLKRKGWKPPHYLSDESTLRQMIINSYENARKKWRSTMGNTVVFSVDDNKDFTDKNFSWVKESINEGISQGDIKVIDTNDIPEFNETKHSYELVYVIKPKVVKVGGETKTTVRFLAKGKYGGRIVDIPIEALKKSDKFEKYKVRFKGDILPRFKKFIKGEEMLESI